MTAATLPAAWTAPASQPRRLRPAPTFAERRDRGGLDHRFLSHELGDATLIVSTAAG